jgi:hypothetical protein
LFSVCPEKTSTSKERSQYQEEPPFKVVRINGYDEVLTSAANLIVDGATYVTVIRLFPADTIHYRNGVQSIARGDQGKAKDRLEVLNSPIYVDWPINVYGLYHAFCHWQEFIAQRCDGFVLVAVGKV